MPFIDYKSQLYPRTHGFSRPDNLPPVAPHEASDVYSQRSRMHSYGQDKIYNNQKYSFDSSIVTGDSYESMFLKELNNMKRKFEVIDEELRKLKKVRQVEEDDKLPIAINFKELHSFLMSDFKLFIRHAIQNQAAWLGPFRFVLLILLHKVFTLYSR